LFLLTTGWDEGVMGMQLGEVARLKVSLHPVQVPICDSFGFHKHEIKAQLFVQCK
jgi:hypothetical protein